MADAIVGAAAGIAINAAVAANDAVEGGAHGPMVITTMMAPPRGLVRVFSFDFGHFQLPGTAALGHLQAARSYFDDLINSHLPFNVGVAVRFAVVVNEVRSDHHIVIPPLACMDGLGFSHDWHTFLERIQEQVDIRVENAEGMDSGPDFETILEVRLIFAPLRDLAAFGPLVHPVHAGGSYVPLPKWIMEKQCTLNIHNKDYNCFRCCLIASDLGYGESRYGLDHPEQWGHYTSAPIPPGRKPKGFKVQYIEIDLDFRCAPRDRSMPLSLIGDWERSNDNRVGIYVCQIARAELYGASDEWVTLLRRPAAYTKFEKEVILLLYKGHYSLVTNFQRLICRQHMSIHVYQGHTGVFCCHRCMRYFGKKEGLDKHLTYFDCVEDTTSKVKRLLPELQEDDSVPVDCFSNVGMMLFNPIVVYADFETSITLNDDRVTRGDKTVVLGCNQNVISAAYHAVGRDGFNVSEEHQAWLYRGVDPMRAFLLALFRLYSSYTLTKYRSIRLVMNSDDKQLYDQTDKCCYCGAMFEENGSLLKCRDHNHFTGEFRGAACSGCNSKARLPREIVIFFHNGGGYDFHFLIRGIADLQASEVGDMTLHELNTGKVDSKMPLTIRDLSLSTIAKSSERFMELRFGPLIFRDSMLFVKEGLGKMVDSQRKAAPQAKDAFPHMAAFHPLANVNLEKLLQKIPFPYSSMRDVTCFRLPALLPQCCYNNDLRQEACNDETYGLVQEIVELFGLTSFGDYHDTYLYSDVLLLCDCMESFRTAFYKMTNIDPAHCVSLPSASKQAMLLATRKTPVHLISEVNGGWPFMNDVNNNIRGGLSNIFVPHVKANNPKVPESYDPTQDTTWITYVDVNSLYPTAMCEMMPEGDYKAVNLDEDPERALIALHHILDNYEDDSTIGYMLVVDHEIPKKLHDKIDFAPVAKRIVKFDELSHRQRQVKEFLGKKPGNQGEKLMPFLGKHSEVAIHVGHLKFLRDVLGTKILKVHRIWSWRQSHWLRDYIVKMSHARQISTDDVEKDVIKLIMNALYGKFLQNKEGYNETKTFTDCERWLRATWKLTGPKRNFNIAQGGINNGVEIPFLGTVTTQPERGVVLDTPRLQGFAILEITKLIMLRLHYSTFKAFYGDRAVLAYTDTDSLIYHLKTNNYLDDFEQINALSPKQVFDLRDTGRVAPNAGQLGLAKDEAGHKKLGLRTIAEFVGAQAKMYSLKFVDSSGKECFYMKAKGIPTNDLKRLHRHNDFLDTMQHPNIDRQVEFRAMRSIHHQMEHRLIKKRGLTGDNDKVFMLGPHVSRPLGHWRNLVPEHLKEEVQRCIEQHEASKWPSLDRELTEMKAIVEAEKAEKRSKKRAVEESSSSSAAME